MSRTPALTAVLWTTVALTGVGCDDNDPAIVDAAPADAPAVDSQSIDAAPPALSFSSTLFMTAPCGGKASSGFLEVTNLTAADVTVSSITATGGFSVLTFGPFAVPANGTVNIEIMPPDSVIGTDLGGAIKTGTLTLVADQGGALPTVALSSTVVGANLTIGDEAGPATTIALQSATSSCPAPRAVFVRNSGNSSATIFSSGASNFALGSLSPSSDVAAGGSISQSISAFTFSACTGSEQLTYSVSGSVCTTTPLVLSASYTIAGSSSCFCS